MSNKMFEETEEDQNHMDLKDDAHLYMVQMLFKEPVTMPDQAKMTAVMEKYVGTIECVSYNEKMAGFFTVDYISEFKDNNVPAQLLVMGCVPFDRGMIDPFLISQMWDCADDKERILEECKYQVMATDMMVLLPPLKRANLDCDFLEALAELYPTCEAFYFKNCGKMLLAKDVRTYQPNPCESFLRFIHVGVNVRFFKIQDSDDMIIDTVGMSTLFLPDLQFHFHNMDPDEIVNYAYNIACYILTHENPIQDGETIAGVINGEIDNTIRWKCQYENALVQPPREVLDVHMGEYASGNR